MEEKSYESRGSPMPSEPNWWENRSFPFIRIPKALFSAPCYEKLSPLAVQLYGLLLDRSSLSWSNGWLDENGSCYIYFTLDEIGEYLKCGHDKATALLRELEQHNLITRRFQGLNKPSRIVVKPFVPDADKPHAGLRNHRIPDCGNTARRTAEIPHAGLRENRILDCGNSASNNTEKNNTEKNNTDTITPCMWEALKERISEQISYDILLTQMDAGILNSIVYLMTEVLQSDNEKEKLMNGTVPGQELRQRLRELDQMDIHYVGERLKRETGNIRNYRCYLLTLLYEAKYSKELFYGIWVNRDMENPPAPHSGAAAGLFQPQPPESPPVLPPTDPHPWLGGT